MARGNARQAIVSDDIDRRSFLDILGQVTERHRWLCHAYCLMTNHYHMLLETLTGDLSGGMRQLNGVYTQRYNRRHDRVGHLFQSRFKSVLVQRDAHLLELSRYIVMNPVVAGLAERPELYPWSSYRGAAGFETPPPWLTSEWLLSQFAEDPLERQRRYRAFVLAPTGQIAETNGPIVGDEFFARAQRHYLEPLRAVREFALRERFADRPSLTSLLPNGNLGSRELRNDVIRRANRDLGYHAAEIARHLGLHPSTVSKIVNEPASPADSRFKT